MVEQCDAASITFAQTAEKKGFARKLFMDTMEAVSLTPRMASRITLDNGHLKVGPHAFPLELFFRVLVVAVGKAAIPMANYMRRTLAPWMDEQHQVTGVVVGRGPWNPTSGWTYLEGSHPLPDTNSVEAAKLLLECMRSTDEKTLVLFLISGGASSMVETPLNPLIPQKDVIAFYQSLLHAGLPIDEMNVLRKHLSMVKGGRLALAGSKATQVTVLIPDVPSGMLDVVGSGLSFPDPSTVEDCWRILHDTPHLMRALPESIMNFFSTAPETPKEIITGKLPTCLSLLSSESLTESASQIAAANGYHVVVDNTCDDWDYRDSAKYLLDRIGMERRYKRRVCLLSAGEVTVTIPGKAGRGGRNQQWVLELARLLKDERFNYTFLSAASDGVDGNSPAAGAVADTRTWIQAETIGLHPQRALTEFDAYNVFQHLQDAVITGPLDNNLRDLRVILAG